MWNEISLFIINRLQALVVYLKSKETIKLLVSYIVKASLGVSGPKAWLASIAAKKLLAWGLLEVNDGLQHLEDNITVKEGDKLEQKPISPEVTKKRKQNFLDLIRGKK